MHEETPRSPILDADIREASERRLCGRILGIGLGAVAVWTIETAVTADFTETPEQVAVTVGMVAVGAGAGVISAALLKGASIETKSIKTNKELAKSDNPPRALAQHHRAKNREATRKLMARSRSESRQWPD